MDEMTFDRNYDGDGLDRLTHNADLAGGSVLGLNFHLCSFEAAKFS